MNNKNAMYLLAGIFTAITVVLVVFLIYPLLSDITRGSQEIIVSRANTVNSELQSQELQKFQKNYQDYQPNFSKADALIVDAKDPIDFIKFLEAAAANSSVTSDIKLVSSHQQTLGTWPAAVFEVASNGSFSGMMIFVQKLETGPYITSIQNVSLKKHQALGVTDSKVTAGSIDADIVIRVVTN